MDAESHFSFWSHPLTICAISITAGALTNFGVERYKQTSAAQAAFEDALIRKSIGNMSPAEIGKLLEQNAHLTVYFKSKSDNTLNADSHDTFVVTPRNAPPPFDPRDAEWTTKK